MAAKMGTLTDAARELYISQPSLTKCIKELEREIGIQIFEGPAGTCFIAQGTLLSIPG